LDNITRKFKYSKKKFRRSRYSNCRTLAFGGYVTDIYRSNRRIQWSNLDFNSPTPGLNTARRQLAGCGTQTAALAFGGSTIYYRATEEYDGATWTSVPPGLNTARQVLGGVAHKQQV
jgi:hypothetical protein